MHTTFCLPIHLSVGTCIYLLAAVKNAAMNMGVQIWKLTFASFVMACAKLLQPCNRMYRSPPGSSDNGISQARILEWVAMASSRESSGPRDQTSVSYVSFFTTSTTREALSWRVVRNKPRTPPTGSFLGKSELKEPWVCKDLILSSMDEKLRFRGDKQPA